MPLSLYALDKFVSQELSKLNTCLAEPVAPDFPSYRSWLNEYVLNRIFGAPIADDKAAFGFSLIRRAEGAIDDYDEGRTHLNKLVAGDKQIALYFRALRKFESAVSLTYQAADFARKATGETLFTKGDESPAERMNKIYNISKHASPLTLPDGYIHTVWIRNDGLAAKGDTTDAELSFAELRDMICQIARIADQIAKMKRYDPT